MHCIISGQVQGIGFREFVRNIAQELGLVGFVANLPDGSVEVLAQGDLGVLKVFVTHITKGPQGAHIRGFYDEWGEAKRDFQGFAIH